MPIETLIETRAQFPQDTSVTPAQPLNAVLIGVNAITAQAGNNFPATAPGNLIRITDAVSGQVSVYTVATYVDGENITIVGTTVRAIANNSTWEMLLASSWYFVDRDPVNVTAYPLKNVVYSGVAARTILTPVGDTAAPKYINYDEGVLVKSVYARLPYQYTLADTWLGLKLVYKRKGSTSVETITTMPEILSIPVENVEIPVNIYVPPMPAGITNSDNWTFAVNEPNTGMPNNQTVALTNPDEIPWISAVNAPAAMDREILPIVIGLRIQHGYDLST